jgi:subtilisin family serine protease
MMIAVGAVDETHYAPGARLPPIADFSNHGAWVTAYSGGVSVLGPYRYDKWAYWNGTSFAAATVTGVIARTKIAHPDLTMRQAAEEVLKVAATIPAWDANGRHESRYIPAKDHRKPPEHD